MSEVVTAQVALSDAIYAIDKPYDYLVPDALADTLLPGMRVIVPFGGGNRRTDGIVLALRKSVPAPGLKTIHTLLDETPVLDEKGLKLALWMRERYFCTVYDAVKAMLPAGLFFALRDHYSVSDGIDKETAYASAGRSEAMRGVLDLVYSCGGTAELSQIRLAFGTKDPVPALKQLTEKGILTVQTSASRGVGDKTEQVVSLAVPAEEALSGVTPRRKSAPLRYAVVELLATVGAASAKELCYFTGASSATLRSLSKSGLVALDSREVLRRVEVGAVAPAGPVVLNRDQQIACDGLDSLAAAEKSAAALLYGVTGSGKTQVYIQLIQNVLARGKSAMVLVPEIALTPQLLQIFTAHFGDSIAVLHSSLRAGERYDEWKRIKNGSAQVVIGTRSAVFAPLSHIGLIVLDEEQEYSYKSENNPRYHTREIAKYRCVQHNALLVLASATPSVETTYYAKQGIYHSFTLTTRYNEQALPRVLIADMKNELRAGNGTCVSGLLRDEISRNLTAGEQTILFLNRRGANRMVSCGECGEVPLCPRCSVHLTYHSANGRLMCHHCGHSQRLPDACPVCGGGFQFIGVGTQKLQGELEELFPGTEIIRMDADTVSAAQSHEKLLGRFQEKRVPILLGTQMVAKGLDFENVTLVGVIAADLSLYVDDFRAAERTFSLLTQVIGRAGRGARTGRAVIQTYTPDHEVIRFAAAQDYDSFYDQEIGLRRLCHYPPYCDVIVLTTSGVDESAVLRTCMRLRAGLEAALGDQPEQSLQILGPAPAAVAKVNNRYRYRLTVLGQNTKPLRRLISQLLHAVHQDKNSRGVSVFADPDPLD